MLYRRTFLIAAAWLAIAGQVAWLQDAEAFGRPRPKPVNDFSGFFDGINGTDAVGWAALNADPGVAVDIHFYDGPSHAGRMIGSVTANQPRGGLPVAGDHGFTFRIPASVQDGAPHQIHAYAVAAGKSALLNGSPRAFQRELVSRNVVVEVFSGAVGSVRVPNATVRIGGETRTSDGNGFTHFFIAEGGYDLTVEAQGYVTHTERVTIDSERDQVHPSGNNPSFRVALNRDVTRPGVRGRLRAQGRTLVYPDGTRFPWRFVSFFGGIAMLDQGREAELNEKLAWFASQGVTGVRTFAMMDAAPGIGTMFVLRPENGRAHLGRYLEMARSHGLYVEIVALANTRWMVDNERFDMAHHVREVGKIAAQHDNALVEFANEANHHTQVSDLADWIETRRHLVPAGVPSATGISDETYYFNPAKRAVIFDYATVHSERADGEGGWRWVRHIKELGDIARSYNRPVVNDEQIGAGEAVRLGARDNNPAKFYGSALVARAMDVTGSTFHYDLGLRYDLPSNIQLECFNAFMRGITLIPDDIMTFSYKNAGFADGPVASFRFSDHPAPDTAIRAYSGLDGNRGYTVVVRKIGDPGIVWQNGWSPRAVHEDYPGMQLIEIGR